MTLYLKDKKYKVEITETIEGNGEGVTLKIYRKRFMFYKCLNAIVVEFDSKYNYPFPRPGIRAVKLGGNGPTSTSHYTDNKSNLVSNMDGYLENLIDTSFEKDLSPSDLKFSYQSYLREQRLKKLLLINEN